MPCWSGWNDHSLLSLPFCSERRKWKRQRLDDLLKTATRLESISVGTTGSGRFLRNALRALATTVTSGVSMLAWGSETKTRTEWRNNSKSIENGKRRWSVWGRKSHKMWSLSWKGNTAHTSTCQICYLQDKVMHICSIHVDVIHTMKPVRICTPYCHPVQSFRGPSWVAGQNGFHCNLDTMTKCTRPLHLAHAQSIEVDFLEGRSPGPIHGRWSKKETQTNVDSCDIIQLWWQSLFAAWSW